MSVLAFPFASTPPATRGDVALRSRIEAALSHPVLRRAGALEVAVTGDIVSLGGMPEDEGLARAVVAAVLGVAGVHTVVPIR